MKAAETLMKVGKGDLELYVTANKATPNQSLFVELLPLIGFFLGLMGGFTLAATLEMADTRLRTAKEVNGHYNIPCIMTVPELKLYKKDREVMENQLRFFIRSVEEAVDKASHSAQRLVLGIVSAQDDEGKSLFAYYLARFYEKLGRSTIVVEFDSKPSSCFEPHEAGKGRVEQFLKGQVTFEDLLYKGHPARIHCGHDVDMKELVKTSKMKELMDLLRKSYDVVILDIPGIVEEDYAVNVLSHSDESVFFISSSKTTRKYVNDSFKDLDFHGIKPIGIVLNRILDTFLDDVRIKAESRRAKYGLWEKFKKLFVKKAPTDHKPDLQPKT
jgi:Mrp family chromosome partitioning ATPase